MPNANVMSAFSMSITFFAVPLRWVVIASIETCSLSIKIGPVTISVDQIVHQTGRSYIKSIEAEKKTLVTISIKLMDTPRKKTHAQNVIQT